MSHRLKGIWSRKFSLFAMSDSQLIVNIRKRIAMIDKLCARMDDIGAIDKLRHEQRSLQRVVDDCPLMLRFP
jgi:hypothetical protein